MCTYNICFEENMKKVIKIPLKIVIFTAVKYPCILHGHVFVMLQGESFFMCDSLVF